MLVGELQELEEVKTLLTKGQQVGMLKISSGDQLLREVPLVALAPVEEAGVLRRAWDAMRLWIN